MAVERDAGARNPENSMMIDIRTLGAMVATNDARRAPAATATSVPAFGSSALVGLGTAVPTPTPAPRLAARAQGSDAPLLAMLGVLMAIVLGLGAYIVLVTPQPVVITTNVPEPEREPTQRRDAAAAALARDVTDELERTPVEEPATAIEPELAAQGPAVVAPKGAKPTVHRTPPTTKVGTPRVEPTPKRDDVPIECVLDPNLAKCGGSKTTARPTDAPRKDTAALPLSLGQTDIRSGVNPLKDTAKACGTKHGAKPGEKVRVKLSIVGATGKVSSAAAQAPHAGTSLGNCVAATLKKASFSRFQKQVIGVVYTITM